MSDDELEDFESVARVVGLGGIINLDSTVLEMADMPGGYYAYRKRSNDKWIIQKQEA